MKEIAIVTGASKGIGLALANKLLEQNYYVIGTSTSGNNEVISNNNFELLQLNLGDTDSIKAFTSIIASRNIKVDLLINNAGIGPDLGFMLPEEKSYDHTFDINTKGTVFFTEAMLEHLNKGSKIINISSKMGSISNCTRVNSIAYCMSKTALNMYTKLLANRLESINDVATIHPGWVQTTISSSNVNAPLTPEDSANRIVKYLQTQLKNGDYWDAEANTLLSW
ncbi:MAG: SDR family NAD(P)-dependent oxidoreductase [bacterium]